MELFNGAWTSASANIAMPFKSTQELEDNKDICIDFADYLVEQKGKTQDESCNDYNYSFAELVDIFDTNREDFEELRARYPKLVELLTLIQGCDLIFNA